MVNISALREKQKEMKIPTSVIASALEIDPSTWYRRLENPSKFTIGEAEALCKLFQLNADEAEMIFCIH